MLGTPQGGVRGLIGAARCLSDTITNAIELARLSALVVLLEALDEPDLIQMSSFLV